MNVPATVQSTLLADKWQHLMSGDHQSLTQWSRVHCLLGLGEGGVTFITSHEDLITTGVIT